MVCLTYTCLTYLHLCRVRLMVRGWLDGHVSALEPTASGFEYLPQPVPGPSWARSRSYFGPLAYNNDRWSHVADTCTNGPMAQWSERPPPKLEIWVQIPGLPNLFLASFGVLACLDTSPERWRLLDHVALLSGLMWPDLVGTTST